MWKPIILDVECIVCNKSLQKINHVPRDASQKMGKIIKLNNNRRLRTPNWSLEEKQYLLELIKQRKEVVVTKTNNGPNHYEEKDIAWNEILRELSAKFGCKFTGSSIKKVKTQWQNMKRIAREEIALIGPQLQNYSRLSLEVCHILELVKDGVLKGENDNLNESSITANIEIKAECIDEDINQPSCSGINNSSMDTDVPQDKTNSTSQLESSESSVSEQVSEANEYDGPEEISPNKNSSNMRTASAMTDKPYVIEETCKIINPFHRELQEYFKYTAAEKQMKMETLKEERQVVRAMRETAELNKIIAEQKLKHVLWVKKHEMAAMSSAAEMAKVIADQQLKSLFGVKIQENNMPMYSGEPGSGAGKGGGGGGAIREAGGAFGKMEAAREDEYFYKKQKEQLANLKSHLDKEIFFHEEQIKRHEDAIRRQKEKMADLETKNA